MKHAFYTSVSGQLLLVVPGAVSVTTSYFKHGHPRIEPSRPLEQWDKLAHLTPISDKEARTHPRLQALVKWSKGEECPREVQELLAAVKRGNVKPEPKRYLVQQRPPGFPVPVAPLPPGTVVRVDGSLYMRISVPAGTAFEDAHAGWEWVATIAPFQNAVSAFSEIETILPSADLFEGTLTQEDDAECYAWEITGGHSPGVPAQGRFMKEAGGGARPRLGPGALRLSTNYVNMVPYSKFKERVLSDPLVREKFGNLLDKTSGPDTLSVSEEEITEETGEEVSLSITDIDALEEYTGVTLVSNTGTEYIYLADGMWGKVGRGVVRDGRRLLDDRFVDALPRKSMSFTKRLAVVGLTPNQWKDFLAANGINNNQEAQPQTQEKNDMDENNETGPVRTTMNVGKDAFKRAATMAACQTANKEAVRLLSKRLVKQWPDMESTVKDEAFQRAMQAALPFIIHMGLETDMGQSVPKRETLQAWSAYSMEATAYEVSSEVMGMLVAFIVPFMNDLGGIVETSADSMGVRLVEHPAAESAAEAQARAEARTGAKVVQES